MKNNCLNCGKPTKKSGNTYCSTNCFYGHKRKVKYPNLKFDKSDFSQKQIEILIGSMLGDGCMNKIRQSSFNSSFTEDHSEDQKDWLLWKQNQLKVISSNYTERWKKGVIILNGKAIQDQNPENKNLICTIETICHPVFTKMEKEWYLRDEKGNYIFDDKGWRIKCLPPNLELTPLILAVWFMDDGINRNQYCLLCTDNFTHDEVKYLSMKINETFNLNSTIVQRDKNIERYRIYINYEDYLKFIEIIKNVIVDLPECMKYKIDISKHKVSWKNSSNYHPRSKLNDEVVKLIFIDAENGMSQVNIGIKYGINSEVAGELLRGKRKRYKSKFSGSTTRYNNKSGSPGVFFNTQKQSYCSFIKINKKCIYLGFFKDKNKAIWIRKQAEELLKENLSIENFKSKIKQIKLRSTI